MNQGCVEVSVTSSVWSSVAFTATWSRSFAQFFSHSLYFAVTGSPFDHFEPDLRWYTTFGPFTSQLSAIDGTAFRSSSSFTSGSKMLSTSFADVVSVASPGSSTNSEPSPHLSVWSAAAAPPPPLPSSSPPPQPTTNRTAASESRTADSQRFRLSIRLLLLHLASFARAFLTRFDESQ